MPRRDYPSDLTDAEWRIVEPLIPPAKEGGRPRTKDMREVINAILYVDRTAPRSTVPAAVRKGRGSPCAGQRVKERGGKLFCCPVCRYEAQADFNASVNVHRSFFREMHRQPRPKLKRSG